MRHYKIVKRSAYFLIAISALAVVVNSIFLAAAAAGLLNLASPDKASAEEAYSCSAPGVFFYMDDTVVEINKDFHVRMVSSDATLQKFSWQIYVTDVATNKEYMIGGQHTTEIGEDGIDLSVNTPGVKKIHARFIRYKDGSWCKDWLHTNEVQFEAKDYSQDSANVTISLTPQQFDLGGSSSINFKIENCTGKKFALYASKGGSCADDGNNASCWGDPLTSSDITGAYYEDTKSWGSSAEVGDHAIKLKVFDSDDNLTDTKIVYATVCPPGTAGTEACTSNHGGGNPGAGGSGNEEIETPENIDFNTFNFFATSLKMPKEIKGVGQLVEVIIKVLIYFIGFLSFMGIIISGLQYITSGGDSSKAEKAKKTMIFSIIGIFVASFAFSLLALAANFWAGPN